MPRCRFAALTLFALALLLPSFAWGQQEEAHPLSPVLSEHTVLVGRFDVDSFDLDAVTTHLKEFMRRVEEGEAVTEADEQIDLGMDEIRRWRAAFKEAGGRELYLVFNVGPASEPFIAAPVAAGADEAKLLAVLDEINPGGDDAMVIEGVVVTGPAEVLEQMEHFIATPRDDLVAFLNQPSARNAEMFVAPAQPVRAMMEIMVPNLPDELGGEPITILSRGVKHVRVSQDVWPKLALEINVQAIDGESAKTVAALLTNAREEMRRQAAAEDVPVKALLDALQPKVEGDNVVIAMDHAQVDAFLNAMIPSLQQARKTTQAVQSMSNIRQLNIAVITHAIDHRSAFPPSLKELLSYVNSPKVFVSPMSSTKLPADIEAWARAEQAVWVDVNSSYVYAPPAAKLDDVKDPARTIMIFEKLYPGADMIAIGFADGHCERLPLEEANKLITEQTGKSLDAWSGADIDRL